MHFHIGFFEFLIFGAYLIIWNALFHLINIEARRMKWTTLAGVTGMHA